MGSSHLPYMDDTAKTFSSLNMLGRHATPTRMCEVFAADTHSRTYTGERYSSFTANCNALLALLNHGEPSTYSIEIEKVARFLCDYRWRSDGKIKDKRVALYDTSHMYSSAQNDIASDARSVYFATSFGAHLKATSYVELTVQSIGLLWLIIYLTSKETPKPTFAPRRWRFEPTAVQRLRFTTKVRYALQDTYDKVHMKRLLSR